MKLDCHDSYIDQQSEPKRRRVNYPEHTVRGSSVQETNDNRQNININVTEEQISENTAIEENRLISTGIIQLLKNSSNLKLNEILDVLLKEPGAHFTGYANILSENDFKGVISMEHLYIQLVGDANVGCELLVVDAETKNIEVVWSSKSIRDTLVENYLSGIVNEGIIDLSNTGCYWEGGVLNGCSPCG